MVPEAFALVNDTYRYSQEKGGTMGKIGCTRIISNLSKLVMATSLQKSICLSVEHRPRPLFIKFHRQKSSEKVYYKPNFVALCFFVFYVPLIGDIGNSATGKNRDCCLGVLVTRMSPGLYVKRRWFCRMITDWMF